ncbi:uncharacterized protein [Typha latifolia]|uniref:uncharacterized protein isoform X2 n=1 Tax=Typha latifolia TaxID=4733 RepID=UPI003C2DC8D5
MGGRRVIRTMIAGYRSADAISARFAPLAASEKVEAPVIDEWELAGGSEEESDLFEEMIASPQRLVFESVPTIEEAKEATLDLKDIAEKVYFAPPVTKVSLIEIKDCEHFETSDSEASISEGQQIVYAAPDHIIQAFTLLRENPDAQDVVASLASDQNVWNAVKENEKVSEFCKKHQPTVLHSESGEIASESIPGDEDTEETMAHSRTCNIASERDTGDEDTEEFTASSRTHTSLDSFRCRGFINLTENIKLMVLDMVNNLSDIFQGLAGTLTGSNSVSTQNQTQTNTVNADIFGSFVILAIATILIVICGR